MKASELKTALEQKEAATLAELGRLRAERIRLALPAHSGDEAAALRLQDLRADIAAKEAEVRDIGQAIGDLEPQLAVERASDVLEHRRQMEGAYRAACAALIEVAGPVDAAIRQLVEACAPLHAAVDRLQRATVEFLVPPGPDVTAAVERRMIASHTTGLNSLHDQIETAIRDVGVLPSETAPYPHRAPTSLLAIARAAVHSTDARVGDQLRIDEAAAREAGVALEAA
jgi:hypothetical protein